MKVQNSKNIAIYIGLLVIATFCGGCQEKPTEPQAIKVEVTLTPEQKFAQLLEKANGGDATAQVQVGRAYDEGEITPKDLTKAFQYIEKAAEQGNAEGQFRLGDFYQRGKGVAENPAKAAEWYEKSAAQNNPDAQLWLAFMYLDGKGVKKDVARAETLLEQASENGDELAILSLGGMYQGNGPHFKKDLAKELALYRKNAERGNRVAQRLLAQMYETGNGVIQDEQVALDWYAKAAAGGDPVAQYEFGLAYWIGKVVPKDSGKAFGWIQKAAIQGVARAQHTLSSLYLSGDGTPPDKVLAYAWANLGASGRTGTEWAANSRRRIESTLTPDELAEAQRLSSAWKEGNSLVRDVVTDTKTKSVNSGTLAKSSMGTLFVVSKTGHAITNQHVINGCSELRIKGREGVAKLVTDDKANDLALLQIQGPIADVGSIASDPSKLRQGEDVLVFGFPLNAVLSSSGNLTPGIVSALTGFGNDTNQIQITAPIQPGSSGSPVMNKKGDVVGVVAMKLSDTKMAQATGQVGQNVNFAVSGQTLRTFLDTHKVSYRNSSLFSFDLSTSDLADEARKWTMVVECWK
jgi:TPR repeat protein